MTQTQTGRDDAMSGISNSLTGNASNCRGIRLVKKYFPEPCVGLELSATWADGNREDPGLQRAKEVCNE